MSKTESPAALEMWGGVECTVNRVGDAYFTQLERSGHAERDGDLDRFASARHPRHPLSGAVGSDGAGRAWRAPTGAGPTSACRPCATSASRRSWASSTTAAGRATPACSCPRFADGPGRVRRARSPRGFPGSSTGRPSTSRSRRRASARSTACGIRMPATTARSSPALLNQCRATVLAMQAIRRVNPAARLVQTDDLGRTYGTEPLSGGRRLLQRAPLARLGSAVRPGRPDARALGLPDRERRRRRRAALVRRPPLPARRHRRQLLRHERALARPSRSSAIPDRGPRRAPTSSTSSRCACWRRRRPALGSAARRKPGSATACRSP